MGYLDERAAAALKATAPQTKAADYDAFWAETLEKARALPADFRREPSPYPGDFVKVWAVSYNGFGGQRIQGWLVIPEFAPKPCPCIVYYHGGNGWIGEPQQYMPMAAAGFAVLTIDPRGQTGDTPDNAEYSSGFKGTFIMRGILDPYEHYLRNLYMDCVRAVDCAAEQPEIDPARIILRGASQGGACTMAAAAFSGKAGLALPDVPSYCNFPRRIENRQACLENAADYLARYPERTDRVLKTLSYFDVINLADRVTCPVYASVGLMDSKAPAEFFIQAYHYIPGPKKIEIYPFNEHGNVSVPHGPKELAYAADWAYRGIL